MQPCFVAAGANPTQVGDEAVLIAKRTHCPMTVCINRSAAVKALLEKSDCDIIISDDGLQHYALARDIEIAVIDGARGFGNHQFLPAGPLREPISRLKEVDFIVRQGDAKQNEFAMQLLGDEVIFLQDPSIKKPLTEFIGQVVHAIAAIGHPERFFLFLRQRQLQVVEHSFPDHALFESSDLLFGDDFPILMTEKDAVKCTTIANQHCWYLPIEAKVDDRLGQLILQQIRSKK